MTRSLLSSLPARSLPACSVFALSLLLVGCFDLHSAPDGGPPLDAGIVADDAALPGDAAAPDAGVDPLVRCAPVALGDLLGEPCFCEGPLAIGDGMLYRRAIGIEVYDLADPRAPVLARVVDERAASGGALIEDRARRLLFSVSDTLSGVTVYDLADPLAPAPIGALTVDGYVFYGALDGARLVMVSSDSEDESVAHVVDVTIPSAPRVERTIALAGRPGGLAVEGDTAALVLGRGVGASDLVLLDLASGATLARQPLGRSGLGMDLALRSGLVYLSGGDRALTLYERDGASLRIRGRLGDEESFVRGIVLHGARAFLGGGGLLVVDVSDPDRPRALGEAAGPFGDVAAIAPGGELAYVSSGNGMVPVALGCE